MRLICAAVAALVPVTVGACGSSDKRQALDTTGTPASGTTTASASTTGFAAASSAVGDYCTSARQLVTDDPLHNQHFTSRQQVVDAAAAAAAQLRKLELETSADASSERTAEVSADYSQLLEAVSELATDAQSAPDDQSLVAEAKGIDNATLEKATDVIDSYTRAKCGVGIRQSGTAPSG
jgi:hypothetical protein